jgi:hypothetical protein
MVIANKGRSTGNISILGVLSRVVVDLEWVTNVLEWIVVRHRLPGWSVSCEVRGRPWGKMMLLSGIGAYSLASF